MRLLKERELIVEYGRKLLEDGLTKGSGGNLSIYNREEGLMAISPSGLDYLKTDIRDIVIMNLDGEIIEGDRQPSSEYQLHTIFYKGREDIGALVHTHSVYATVLGILRQDLPPASYLVAVAGRDVRCGDYASYGTRELAENTYRAMEDRYAAILANHGLLAGHESLERAYNIALQIEHCAEVYCKALAIGRPSILDGEEMDSLTARFETYGPLEARGESGKRDKKTT